VVNLLVILDGATDTAPSTLEEAGHAGDRIAKIAVLEQADREIVGPLAKVVRARGGEIQVCADHGCDPDTRAHIGGPVPRARWSRG
jgi:2,3-bisphosphoglycerate-independent phosphoglycerate mutase